jgi:hypothetical protein
MVRSRHDPPHRDPQHTRNGKRRDEPLCGGHAQQRRRHCPRRMTVTGFVVMMGHGFLYNVTVRGCRWRWRGNREGHAKSGAHSSRLLGFPQAPGSASVPPALPGEVEAPWVCGFGACMAGISTDICSRCGSGGLPNRHMESTSAAATRRTSMRYGSLRRRCSRPTGCRVAACGGFSPRRARSPWWREPTARSRASPSCCFVLTAGWHVSILSQ